jgi:hypothetical protein
LIHEGQAKKESLKYNIFPSCFPEIGGDSVPEFFWKIVREKNRMERDSEPGIAEGKMKGLPILEVFSDYV